MEFPFETWDVFTDRAYAGNPLAVVKHADTLTTEKMQTIAREFNLSETVFILTPTADAYEARIRIFTPAFELPYAGHPTVGAAISIATERGVAGQISLELAAGIFPIVFDDAGDALYAEFVNPNLPVEGGSDMTASASSLEAPLPEAVAIEKALSLPFGALDRDAHKPRLVGAGVDYLYVRASLDNVRKAQLNSSAYDALALDDIVGVLLYAPGGEAQDAAYHTRMFAPGAGIPEDPATGSAAAALPGQIHLADTLSDGEHHWIVEQGFEMGRPSRIGVKTSVAGGEIEQIRVGGTAIKISSGVISA